MVVFQPSTVIDVQAEVSGKAISDTSGTRHHKAVLSRNEQEMLDKLGVAEELKQPEPVKVAIDLKVLGEIANGKDYMVQLGDGADAEMAERAREVLIQQYPDSKFFFTRPGVVESITEA